MAKKSKQKERSILVRDLSKSTIDQLEFYKNKNGIKTDSKAVVSVFANVERYLLRIESLENQVESIKEKSEIQHEIIYDIYWAKKNLNDYFSSE